MPVVFGFGSTVFTAAVVASLSEGHYLRACVTIGLLMIAMMLVARFG